MPHVRRSRTARLCLLLWHVAHARPAFSVSRRRSGRGWDLSGAHAGSRSELVRGFARPPRGDKNALLRDWGMVQPEFDPHLIPGGSLGLAHAPAPGVKAW